MPTLCSRIFVSNYKQYKLELYLNVYVYKLTYIIFLYLHDYSESIDETYNMTPQVSNFFLYLFIYIFNSN